MEKRSAIVIGAGIVGLAAARALAIKGFSVTLIERNHRATGASVRNFGMIWPVGQPEGNLYERAIKSRNIWKTICDAAGIWYEEAGSIHVAHHPDEWQVLKELYESFYKYRPVELLSVKQTAIVSAAAETATLIGSLYSKDEMIVNPVQAMEALPVYFKEAYGVEFVWGKCVSHIKNGVVYTGLNETHEADLVFICSGADFETLYPEAFRQFPLTKCKLQMMRSAVQPGGWRMGPAICGGLSLGHYKSFEAAASLKQLKQRFVGEMEEYTDWGIHVMACQHESGQVTIGDSHEYGNTHDPFDREKINTLVISYLKKIARLKDWQITETWNGIYPKLTNGETEMFFSPEQNVYVLNGLGGAGMTLSFGYAEEMMETL